MKYFIIKQDNRIENPVNFRINEENLNSKTPLTLLDDEIGFSLQNKIAVDLIVQRVLFNSHFFVSIELMQLLSMYDENLLFTPLFIADEKIRFSYFKLNMDITEDTKNLNKPIHLVYKDKQAFLLVSLHVLESILRRYPIGIAFEEFQ